MKTKNTQDQPRWLRPSRAGRPQHKPKKANLALVKSVPQGALQPGTIVWAHIPFQEGGGETTRPAVVKSCSGRTVTLLPVTTSKSRKRYPWAYVELRDLRTAGLSRATGVRLNEVTVDLIEVINVSGNLADSDLHRVLGSATTSVEAA